MKPSAQTDDRASRSARSVHAEPPPSVYCQTHKTQTPHGVHSPTPRCSSTLFRTAALMILSIALSTTYPVRAAEHQGTKDATTTRDEDLSQLLETYTPQLDLIVPMVLKAANRRKDSIKLSYSTSEEFFSVYVAGAGSNIVYVNLGGLNPID